MRIIRIGFNPILIVASLILIAIIAFGANSNQPNTNTVSLSDFTINLKNNDYAVLDIKDDGTAQARPKYILRSVQETAGAEVTERDETNYASKGNKLQSISFDQLYELIRPKNFIESLYNPSIASFGGVKELIVGDDYILAIQAVPSLNNYIVEQQGEQELNRFLDSKGQKLNSLGVTVSFLRSASKSVGFDQIQRRNNASQVQTYFDLGDEIVVRLKDDSLVNDVVNWDYAATEGLAKFLQDQGVDLTKGNIEFGFLSVPTINWGDILSLVMIGVAVFFAFFLIRSIQSGGSGLMKFGQSKARLLLGEKPDTTFDDVAGVDEAKEELSEIVEFLKNPGKFLKLGARIPKGVLMVGSPGTGKTLLARAIAGEAGVPFFHTSGSEFEEMLVGAGASRVRDLFEKAKKSAPALIFIDEIDAVARKRGTTIQSSTTEQTLNQILTEMDGFEKNTNIIVIAATNRPDVLDPAILRPGRFDRRVVIDLPDMKGREQILKIHAKNKPLAENVDLERIAKRTVGFSGAELENMMNEAAIIAAKADRHTITAQDIEESASKTTMGPAKKNRVRTDKELKLVAVHEAGHAVVSKFVPQSDPVHRVSIVSRGMAGGVTEFLPETDENIITRTKLFSRIVVSLGGRAAEDVVLGDITTGASSDIEHATSIARRMVQKFGMSEKLGLIKYGESNELQYLGYGYGEQRDYSDDTAHMIDEEVRSIVQKAYKEALDLLGKHRVKLDELTKMLLEKEVVEGEDFDKLFAGDKK